MFSLFGFSRVSVIFLLFSIAFSSCKKEDNSASISEQIISEIKDEFAPDKRVALFDITSSFENGRFLLSGETNLPEALKKLTGKLEEQGLTIENNVQLLPEEELGENTFAIVNISVANIRSKPKHSAELATQAILGTPLKVLKKEGSWYLVQTPDHYISWVDAGGILLTNKAQQDAWIAAKKIIFLTKYGEAYSETNPNSQTVSDLVLGNILKLEGESGDFYEVTFPDGRTAFVEKNKTELFDTWLSSLHATENSLVETSKLFMGVPYLWGGTSFKGVDCSGFTKSVYFLNGYILPRDASQQVFSGKLIDTSNGFDDLKPGDLLFFGRKATPESKERIIHVGMWIGNNEFIHSSGRVRINSFDKNADNFNEYELNRFIRAKRILNNPDENKLKLAKDLKMSS
ncbi:C40 family peptidase [Flexithrix dorotheae]|uniref:C40 family peptidase n=1 Tax=Flexithrix dorotheae TaxID=70993 RepID=UPI000380023C|nr:C40 family peptidase [Flexithrix dorotheae]